MVASVLPQACRQLASVLQRELVVEAEAFLASEQSFILESDCDFEREAMLLSLLSVASSAAATAWRHLPAAASIALALTCLKLLGTHVASLASQSAVSASSGLC